MKSTRKRETDKPPEHLDKKVRGSSSRRSRKPTESSDDSDNTTVIRGSDSQSSSPNSQAKRRTPPASPIRMSSEKRASKERSPVKPAKSDLRSPSNAPAKEAGRSGADRSNRETDEEPTSLPAEARETGVSSLTRLLDRTPDPPQSFRRGRVGLEIQSLWFFTLPACLLFPRVPPSHLCLKKWLYLLVVTLQGLWRVPPANWRFTLRLVGISPASTQSRRALKQLTAGPLMNLMGVLIQRVQSVNKRDPMVQSLSLDHWVSFVH
jgi:hypothetical protein